EGLRRRGRYRRGGGRVSEIEEEEDEYNRRGEGGVSEIEEEEDEYNRRGEGGVSEIEEEEDEYNRRFLSFPRVTEIEEVDEEEDNLTISPSTRLSEGIRVSPIIEVHNTPSPDYLEKREKAKFQFKKDWKEFKKVLIEWEERIVWKSNYQHVLEKERELKKKNREINKEALNEFFKNWECTKYWGLAKKRLEKERKENNRGNNKKKNLKGFEGLDKDYYITSCEEMEKATNYLFAYLDVVYYLEGNLPDEKENEKFHQDLTVPLNLERFKNIKFINKCFGNNNDWQNKFNELAKLPKTQPRNLLGWMRKATTAFLLKDKNPPNPNNKTLIYLLDDKIYIKNKEDFYKEIEPKGLTTQKYYLILWTNIFFKNEIILGETKETINKLCNPPLRKIENKKYLEDLERSKNYLEKWKNEAEKLSSEYTSKNKEFLKIIEENENDLETKKWFEDQVELIKNKIKLIETLSNKNWNFNSLYKKFGSVEIEIERINDEWNKKLEESGIKEISLKQRSRREKNIPERKKLSDYLFNGNNSSPDKTIKSPDKTIRNILEEPKDKTSLTNKICPKPIRKAISNLLACFVNV
uniref:Uncharacterized protein n=1 Tax=Meloidogyne floridensis TaxID=298350 RepID=A0A915P2T5_9BILA